MSDTCSLFPLFGDPWPSCLLPSQPLGQEDPLEKEMAAHSSVLAWEIPWKKKPEGYSPWSHKESDKT